MTTPAADTPLRIGIIGCGRAARIHADRLIALPGVSIIACSDADLPTARDLASTANGVAAYDDHRELLATAHPPDVVAIFTPHRAHYRPAMDALQAGCHVFVEKPLSTNTQEAADIVNLARCTRPNRRRRPPISPQPRLIEARAPARRRRDRPASLVTAVMAAPWLAQHWGPEDSWRLDPKVSGGGISADAGDHLLDALLWTTGRTAVDVAAFQSRVAAGLDVVTAAAIRLAGGIPATLAVSGVSPPPTFELTFFGEAGRLRATDTIPRHQSRRADPEAVRPTHGTPPPHRRRLHRRRPRRPTTLLPGDEALETVRLLEAIIRSAASGQVVRVA